MSRQDQQRLRHEYLLKEIRLSADDLKIYIDEKLEPHNKRIRSLENWRIFLTGGLGGILTWLKFGGR